MLKGNVKGDRSLLGRRWTGIVFYYYRKILDFWNLEETRLGLSKSSIVLADSFVDHENNPCYDSYCAPVLYSVTAD